MLKKTKLHISFFLLLITYSAVSQVFVPINSVNRLKIIECNVDGTSLDFIFDTGASKTLISLESFKKMQNNGFYAIPVESVKMQTADGSVIEAIIYKAKKIIIQELVLEDIKFAVINKPNITNLLGQNVFNRFKSYEIKENSIAIYPMDYLGSDFYKRKEGEASLKLAYDTIFKGTFELIFDSYIKQYTLYNGSFKIEKPYDTVYMEFDIFLEKPINEEYRVAYYYKTISDGLTYVTRDLINFSFTSLKTGDLNKMGKLMIELILRFNIQKFTFNYTISFKDKDVTVSKTVFTEDIIDNKGKINSNLVF